MVTTLYKKNGKKVQKWSIEVELAKYRSIEGFVDGAFTTSQWTMVIGKNIGKKNEVSPYDQALKEAEAKVKLKREKGYVDNPDGVGVERFEPMLAHKWSEQKDKIIYPCYVQPKLDGMRCPISAEGAVSRLGKSVSVPHITDVLKDVFEKNPGLVLDGELYNHELRDDFNTLISLVKKNKPGSEKIEYHVYDAFFSDHPDIHFAHRYVKVSNLLRGIPGIVLVNTILIDEKGVGDVYEKYLHEGYEGMMYRNNTPYVQKRTNNLLKRKEFVDDEFEITDIIEGVGNRSGMMGKFIMKTKEGNSFEADGSGLGGHEVYVEILKNKKDYIGMLATVKYQNLTPDRQVPRFGKVVAIRDYE